MKVNWTADQQKVIDLRDRNILVSAAAGSGKTAVLVERIVTMLTDEKNPVDVDRLLVVTFTEAAAGEMKERIRDAIEKKLFDEPGNEHLSRQATLIHNAQITTIHSFCLSVIRDHFHAISIDPTFRVGEEGELTLLRYDVLEEVLEEKYQEKDPKFLDFISAYGGGKSDKKIQEYILDIYDYSRSYPQPEKWLKSCIASYDAKSPEDLEHAFYMNLMQERVNAYLQDAENLLQKGIDLCLSEDGPLAYETTLRKDLQILDSLKAAKGYQEQVEAFGNISWSRLATNKDKTVSELKIKQVKELRDEVKKLIKTIVSQYFYAPIEEILSDLKMCKGSVEELVELVLNFAKAFQEKKRERNLIDFSDMEQYALRILTEEKEGELVPSFVAREYQDFFKEIMIDEYQDSNLIQETILTSVSTVSRGKYNIFMVGDVKQSIYRFRLSRPELFMEKYNTYDVNDSMTQRIDLHKNFRSRSQVLDSVNGIFRQIMAKDLGGIDYDDDAALYVGASYGEDPSVDNRTEMLLYENQGKDGTDLKVSDKELEARGVALRIKKLMESHKIIDKKTGEFRSLRYSDIVILMRSTSGMADIFSEILTKEGIPNYTGTKEGYFKTQEIGILMDYLRILDNKAQDVPLAAVLTSPMGGVKEEDLAKVKSTYPDLSFHEAVFAYVNKLKEEGSERQKKEDKILKCMDQVDEFRKILSYTSIHELLWKILDETGYEDYVSAMPGGEIRKANLQILIQKARDFESTSYKGLFHFVRYIEKLQKYNVDYGEASMEDEQSDSVRIMTIHKSKGLEFPVVFVCGIGKRMNLQDASGGVLLHSTLGIGMDAMDIELHTKSPSLIKKIIQREEYMDTWAEELRILYVALTRAKEKLIITGVASDFEKKMAPYEHKDDSFREGEVLKILPYHVRVGVSTYMDWLIPAVCTLSDSNLILLKVIDGTDIVTGEIQEIVTEDIHRWTLESWNTEITYNKEAEESLEEQFSYQYPYDNSRNQKMKYTVSELKKRIRLQEMSEEPLEENLYQEPEVTPLVPKFLQEETTLTGALKGTAYHRVMELLSYENLHEDYAEVELKKDLLKFVKEGKLDSKEAECIREKEILGFLKSDLGKRMCDAANNGNLFKEQPFVLGVSEAEVEKNGDSKELLLVQGVIDVFFQEEEELVLLDYKTDRVKSEEELVKRYHGQMDYYEKALEQITKKKVKERIIYSFCLQKEIYL